MKLNDAHIENMLDTAGNELTLVRKFGEVVKHAELVADVYMNDRKVFTAPVCVTENTGYLMASIDGRFALDPAITLERVLVRVRHVGREEVLFSSNTVGVNQPIDAYDYDADIYFRLMNVWEGNATRTRAPETKFRCLYKNTFGTINLDEQPSAYDDIEPDQSGSGDGGSEGDSEGGDGSQSGSSSFDVDTFKLITAENFDLDREEYLGKYFEYYPNFDAIQATWDGDWDHSSWPWLAIKYDFDKPYHVSIKYTDVEASEPAEVYNSINDGFTNGVPTTASTYAGEPWYGEPQPRTYFLVNIPYDMNMPAYAYNAAGTECQPLNGTFTVTFTPAE